MVERHGVHVGGTGQGVRDAGGQQDDVAGHQPKAGPGGNAQPHDAVGDSVEGRAGHGVQGQAPWLGGAEGRGDCSPHTGHREHGGQGIHGPTVAIQAEWVLFLEEWTTYCAIQASKPPMMSHTVRGAGSRPADPIPHRRKVPVMNLTGSVALVTGANRGLGARLVAELLRAGAAKVYATSRAPRVAAPAGTDPRVQAVTLDVTDPASVAAVAAATPDVTVLVNNAGALAFGSALTGDLASFERDLGTNYLGTLRVTRAFASALERNAPAAIVNILTLIALAPAGPMAGYS